MQIMPHNCRCSLSNRSLPNLKLKIPPPAYMLLFAGLMWLLHEQFPLAVWVDAPWNRLGWLIMAISIVPVVGAFRQFRAFGTTPDPFHPERASTLVTSGVYALSRNPMYLALLILLIGWAAYLGSAATMAFPPLFAWIITTQQITWEELALEKAFGQEYLAYRTKVRRWL